jgi:hypothetical protein
MGTLAFRFLERFVLRRTYVKAQTTLVRKEGVACVSVIALSSENHPDNLFHVYRDQLRSLTRASFSDDISFAQVHFASVAVLSEPFLSRESVHIQFVSQVLPPSTENACSQRGDTGELIQV